MNWLKQLAARLQRLWHTDIWAAATARDRSFKGRAYAVLRVISITISGLQELKVAARAAALSYSSLLGLGPLVALTVLIAGFALGDRDPVILARSLNNIISFVAPQVAQYDRATVTEPEDDAPPELREAAPPGPRAAATAQPDPELVKFITHLIESSRSGAAGALGLLTLLIIAVQLFTTVENAFNDIWGVRRGRSWLTRIVYYWTVITLGALLFFTSFTLLSAGTFIGVFLEKLPMGGHLKALFAWMLPSSSAVLLVIVLTLFYRAIPNTRVRWTAALIGAIVVTALLLLNNTLAFLYFKRVVLSKSLYGSVALPIVLMLGLYIFWFFVLVGGQITYAVQNVHYRSSQTAWHSLNHFARESLSLLVLLLIARRFKECLAPYSVTQLAHRIRVPSQVLNESLNRLCDLQLIAQLPSAEDKDPNDYRYQPARPLNKVTLLQFQQLFVHYGESPSGEMLDSVDPILAHYHARLAAVLPEAIGGQTLDELLESFESKVTRAPFVAPDSH
ncbi:MAG: YihY/virulence factor BrkB family protein [Candidatus Didemnitutus sp.]|nr:YihY/virulence factor BrkB family protein [Candidatus Didemnitutus sp.]